LFLMGGLWIKTSIFWRNGRF